MPQVYIVLHDNKSNVLVAKKNKTCSFWKGKETNKKSPVNGGGKYCYPGGKLENGFTPTEGALQEFLEETGNPGENVYRFKPTIETREYKDKHGATLYHAVFVCVGEKELKVLAAISKIHIEIGHVTDKELASVEVVDHETAKERFGDAKDRDIGWYNAPTLDLGTLATTSSSSSSSAATSASSSSTAPNASSMAD